MTQAIFNEKLTCTIARKKISLLCFLIRLVCTVTSQREMRNYYDVLMTAIKLLFNVFVFTQMYSLRV